MPEDSSSGARRSTRRSSSRRISTQRERNDDDEYDYHSSNDYRNHRSGSARRSSSQPSYDTYHHSSSSGRHQHSHKDEGSSRRSSRSKQPPIATATPARKVKTVISVQGYEDDSTVSSLNNDKPKEKWHQKTWVRILLGCLVILITVIITFFVLRATGLGLEKTSSNSGSLSDAPRTSEATSSAPSSAPTPVPFFTYPQPDEDTCDGKSFETGDTSFVNGENTREFDFSFDVTLSFADSSGLWVQEFLEKINEELIPILVGCTHEDADDRRLKSKQMRNLFDNTKQLRGPLSYQGAQLDELERLQNRRNRNRRLIDSDEIKWRYVIGDGTVVGSGSSEIVCPEKLEDVVLPQQNPRQGLPEVCYRIEVYVDLFLRGEERVFSLVKLITTVLTELSNPFKSEPSEDEVVDPNKPASLLEYMDLEVPFKKVSVVGVTNRDPTKSPSTSPSQVPTNRPSFIPTNRPSISPTLFPTHSPSNVPSYNPTERPSLNPTPNPTTPFPSKSPSDPPTVSPSNSPTKSFKPTTTFKPSSSPTLMPTCADFWDAQDTDNLVIDPNDPPDTRCESEDEDN